MIWSIENWKLYYLYDPLAKQTWVMEMEFKFQALAPPSKLFGSISGYPKLVGLWAPTSAPQPWNQAVVEL